MKLSVRKTMFVGICIGIAGLIAGFTFSARFRASVYRAVPFGGSYSTYERLAASLCLGMSTDEVRSILGSPQTQEQLEHGQRWIFFDDGPTAGWTCVVDFSSGANTLRLAYFFNVQHRAFTNSLHRELGSPVDGGEFRSDPFLKMRRDQWYKKTLTNNSRPTSLSL